MPSHTAASALVKLYSLNGAPWQWEIWQDRTKVRHGLFPEDDKKLPRGWTRRNAVDVRSYFLAYQRLSSEEKKITFSTNSKGVSEYPGREFWNAWVSRQWNAWSVHSAVVEELKESDVHPLNILVREQDLSAPWPPADTYLPLVLDGLALRLFGDEAFSKGSAILSTELRKCLQIIAQRSWNTIRIQVGVMKNRPAEIEAAALAAFQGNS